MKNTFNPAELQWLSKNTKIADHIYLALEDSENVNPLDSGEPNMEPYNRMLIAAQITISASEKNIVSGPYNEEHYKLICTRYGIDAATEKMYKFWGWFHFNCATINSEGNRWPKERIYLEALAETIRMYPEFDKYNTPEDSAKVVDLTDNTIKIQKLKGEGVNAKFK